ncbi:hypothetical protein JMT66_23730 (plasmid) [Kosakonia cowanii]|uniref:hypothetical protein n=1 Tax=Kosakonia cowanii TaxID=208223 RepID=UPI001E355459|nr:hypothetical protein [Kosakonia cowanii]UGS48556.1 hypothetical protein JMT66_23730 [Kosakonia cowanii]
MMIIEFIKTALTIPSSINGLLAGRVAYKATVQLKMDISTYMTRGIAKVNRVLDSATPLQKKQAFQEYKKWSLPRKNPNAIRKLSVNGCPPVHHVNQLFSVRKDIVTVLNTNGVYLDHKLRRKLINLDGRLNDYELSYAKHESTKFHYARCFILRAKMRAIKCDTGY